MKTVDIRERRSVARGSARPPYRREQILRVAMELFHRRGVSSTNVEAIAEEVGVRPASLYHHFRDKQAIIDAAVGLAHARMVSRLEKHHGAKLSPEDRLGALVDDLVDYVVEDVPLAAVGRHDHVHAGPGIRRRADQAETLLEDSIVSVIAGARPGLSEGACQALARALIGAIWSVTHSDLRLEGTALRRYLRRAGRAVVLGRRAKRVSAE